MRYSYHPETGQTLCIGGCLPADPSVISVKFGEVINLSTLSVPSTYDPLHYDWARGSPALNKYGLLNILANNKYGCCVFTACGHAEDQDQALSGNVYTPITSDQVVQSYALTGFDPVTGANDDGAEVSQVLEWWRTVGLFDGRRILGHAKVNAADPSELAAALWLFEGGINGMGLDDTWVAGMDTMTSGFVWPVGPGGPNPNNGHSTYFYGGFNRVGPFIDTWGMTGTLTWSAAARYCTGQGEAHVVITEQSLSNATKKSAAGFDAEQLLAKLSQVS